MSRAESAGTYQTSAAQNSDQFKNSQNSYTLAQQDASDYQSSLAKYAASNPYTSGGELQTDTTRELSNTSDAAAQAAGQAMQGQAVRTGVNAGGAIAGTEAAQEANERGLGADEAKATTDRIGAKAAYDNSVLGATGAGESMQDRLAQQQGQLAEGDLTQENTAAKDDPSFMDQFGGAFASGLGKVAASGIGTAASAAFGGG